MRFVICIGLAVALGAGLVYTGCAQQPGGGKEDAEIVQALEKLAKAFNAGDAKGVAAVWSEKGEYVSEDSGERLEGRKAIEADFAEIFAKKKEARLEIDIGKVRRVSPDVASVEGIARVTRPKEPVHRSHFVALLVRQGGAWLIDSVRENSLAAEPSNAAFLEGLAWLNGTWNHKDADTEVTLECDETANGNFRTHRFEVKSKGEVIHEGTQIIGWDPVKKQLRSWVFANDGSFGEGMIEQNGNRLIIRANGVLTDGDKSSATQIITRKDDNSFTWQVIDRHVGTRALPNVEEITLTKSATAPKKGG